MRNKSYCIDVNRVARVLKDWKCNVPGIEKLHMVYVRNITKRRLPTKCKKLMRKV